MPEEDIAIPHAPPRTPLGRCCCSSGGVCFSDNDFEMMFWVNKTNHPENFKHITGPRMVRFSHNLSIRVQGCSMHISHSARQSCPAQASIPAPANLPNMAISLMGCSSPLQKQPYTL